MFWSLYLPSCNYPPCNCHELVIIVIVVILQDIPYVKSYLLYFSIKIRQLLWYESLKLKLVKTITYLSIINVTKLIKLAALRK